MRTVRWGKKLQTVRGQWLRGEIPGQREENEWSPLKIAFGTTFISEFHA